MTESVKTVQIDPDGSVTYHRADLAGLADAAFDGQVDIVLCGGTHRRAPGRRALVGAVHDLGALLDLPVNVKAWALTGRSPVFGPMFVAYDSDEDGLRPPLPDDLVRSLADPDYPGPTIRASMAAMMPDA